MAAEEQTARALAHYIWPPQWVGAPPSSPNSLGDVVAAAELRDGIQARVFRDGMVAFALGPNGPSYETDFVNWLQAGVRLMNAHLACLHTVMGWPPIFRSAVVTPWTTMQVSFESGRFDAMTDAASGGTMLALYKARLAALTDTDDWRFRRGGSLIAISADWVEESLDLLRHLLDRPAGQAVLLRAEMLLRAKAALLDRDPSGALTNAWTAMEGLLGDLFRRYLDENANRICVDASGSSRKFVDPERRKYLDRMTSRHVVEVLSLLDVLPFPLYEAAIECGRARNRWLHAEEVPSIEVANLAISACGELFELVEGVPLQLLPSASGRRSAGR